MSGANIVSVLAAIFWGIALLYGGYYLYRRFGKGQAATLSVRWLGALLAGAVGFSLLGVVLSGLAVPATPAPAPTGPTRGTSALLALPAIDLSAVLLAVVFLVGILFFLGLLVQRARVGQRVWGVVAGFMAFLVLVAGLHALSAALVVIGSNEVGVIFSAVGGTRPVSLSPGLHVIVPYAETIYRYSIQQRTYTFSSTGDIIAGETGEGALNVVTSDGLAVGIDCSVRYAIDPTKAVQVHQNFRDAYPQILVYPTVRAAVSNHIARYTRTQVYGPERQKIQSDIEADIRATLESEGLILHSFSIRNVTLPADYAASLESTQIAKQEATRMQYLLEKEQKETERKKAAAQGDKEAAIIRAEGEAEALRLISAVLKANPDLVVYRYVEKLAPNVQVILLPGDTPFILDPRGFARPAVVSPTATVTSTVGASVTPSPTTTP